MYDEKDASSGDQATCPPCYIKSWSRESLTRKETRCLQWVMTPCNSVDSLLNHTHTLPTCYLLLATQRVFFEIAVTKLIIFRKVAFCDISWKPGNVQTPTPKFSDQHNMAFIRLVRCFLSRTLHKISHHLLRARWKLWSSPSCNHL